MNKRDEIEELVKYAITNTSAKNKVIQLGKLTKAECELIQLKTGINVAGYTRVLDKSGIKHAMNQHGNIIVEKKRGQVAITTNDFLKIPDIVKSENVIYSGKNKIGRDCILYQAVLGDYYYYVEEVRTGKKQLCIQTIYKKLNPNKSWFGL